MFQVLDEGQETEDEGEEVEYNPYFFLLTSEFVLILSILVINILALMVSSMNPTFRGEDFCWEAKGLINGQI